MKLKRWKRLLAFVLCVTLVFGTNRIALFAGGSTEQITYSGESVSQSADGISVSKIATGTETENVFDITLKVETDTEVEKLYSCPPVSVVVVLDISNTMFTNLVGTKTQYEVAMESLKHFIEKFYHSSRSSVVPRELSVVTFNTHAQMQLNAVNCATTTMSADDIYNQVKSGIDTTVGDLTAYDGSIDRFTNIEAGLLMAGNQLKNSKTDHKFVILLTDGMPTTYSKNSNDTRTDEIQGYSPVCTSGTVGVDGVFHSALSGSYCIYGTNYSDKGAARAQEKAAALKESGVKIYSVGINVEGRSIESYAASVNYTIDSMTTVINDMVINQSTTHVEGNNKYEDWLHSRIGSNMYHKGNDVTKMNQAYDQVFADVVEVSKEKMSTHWVITDPMNNGGLLGDYIEFLGFYDKDTNLQNTLIGASGVDKENTATFDSANNKINWDIAQSGFQTRSEGGKTITTYEMKYKIRLKNEASGFVPNADIKTNGDTILKYIINHSGTMKPGSISFKVPTVKGYVTDFEFTKKDSDTNAALQGAKFQLVHDTACPSCASIGTPVSIAEQNVVSQADGKVKFTKLPSGHTYTMTETEVPTGYVANTHAYQVIVANGTVTVDGTPLSELGNTKQKFSLNYVVKTPAADCPDAATPTPSTVTNKLGKF